MKTIYKYPAYLNVAMPIGARIIRVGQQEGSAYIWAIVDPNADTEPRNFFVAGTGAGLPDSSEYIGTFEEGVFVWHVFEQKT